MILTLQTVTCENEVLKTRIERVVKLALTTIDSLDNSFHPIEEIFPSSDAQFVEQANTIVAENGVISVLGKRKLEDEGNPSGELSAPVKVETY